jgi:hypothetical protein
LIKWQRQTADWAFSIVAAVRLSEQFAIPYFSRSLLACFFVLRPMILLAVNAAIFHEFASRAYLEFDVVVPSRNTTRGTYLICLLPTAAHYYAKKLTAM